MKTTAFAAAAALGLLAAGAAGATAPYLTGQTISLPLNEESDGPTLKVVVSKAVLENVIVWGERGSERKARANQVSLNGPYGPTMVKFVRGVGDDLRNRYGAAAKPVTADLAFQEKFKIAGGKLMGDALLAGFTLGIGAPATTPMNFTTHMDLTIDGKTYGCDAEEPGRVPKNPPRKGDTHYYDEFNRMAADGHKTCWAQIAAQLDGKPIPAAAPAATPAAQ
jgi:hypothetical protein